MSKTSINGAKWKDSKSVVKLKGFCHKVKIKLKALSEIVDAAAHCNITHTLNKNVLQHKTYLVEIHDDNLMDRMLNVKAEHFDVSVKARMKQIFNLKSSVIIMFPVT